MLRRMKYTRVGSRLLGRGGLGTMRNTKRYSFVGSRSKINFMVINARTARPNAVATMMGIDRGDTPSSIVFTKSRPQTELEFSFSPLRSVLSICPWLSRRRRRNQQRSHNIVGVGHASRRKHETRHAFRPASGYSLSAFPDRQT